MTSLGARRGLRGVAVVLLLLATSYVHSSAELRRSSFPPEEDALYLPRASAIRTMALGHHELAADLVFVRGIVYFGGQLVGSRDYRWLDNYLDTIIQLDPRFLTPYRWAGVITMYNGKKITNESVLRSNHFLELGVKQFAGNWELAFMLGCNYLFELKTDNPEQRKLWRSQGAHWIQHAALIGGGPSWLPVLAATIFKEEGRDEAAIRHLEEIYLTSEDEKTRTEVRNELLALHGKLDFHRAEQERAKFEAAWRKSLPYVPPDLFVIFGEAPSPRVDLSALEENLMLTLGHEERGDDSLEVRR